MCRGAGVGGAAVCSFDRKCPIWTYAGGQLGERPPHVGIWQSLGQGAGPAAVTFLGCQVRGASRTYLLARPPPQSTLSTSSTVDADRRESRLQPSAFGGAHGARSERSSTCWVQRSDLGLRPQGTCVAL